MSEYVRYVKQLTKSIEPRLGLLDIELTERCNNDCIHCCINRPAHDADARRREMTTVQVKDILEQAADLGCLKVRYTGGEPLLRTDFEELYLFARRLGMKVLLFTNGRLITSHLAELLARFPPLEPIEITGYGMCRESYEAVTGAPGSFEQFWRGVNLLLEHGVPFIVKSALLPPNKNEMDEFEAWSRTLRWMSGLPVYAMYFDLRNRRDNPIKNRQIKSLRLSPQEGLEVYLRNKAKHSAWTPELASKLLRPHGARLFNCGACKGRHACVDAYGRAQPCMGVRAPELTYNIVGPSELDRWSLRDVLDQFTGLRSLRATNPEYLRRCAACFIKGICDQCPARSWTENGAFDTPVEYLCDVTHTMARYAGLLGRNEHGWEVIDGLEMAMEHPSGSCDDDKL